MERMTQNIKHSKNNLEAILERSPIHAQSTWIKAIIKEVGKIDAAHVLIDSLIYNLNKYKAFAINGADEFGLLYCAKEYQDSLKVSYKRARAIPNELVNDGWLESIDQRFTYNKKFYKPTSKALDFIYRLHLVQNDHIGDNGNIDKMALVPNGQTTCANLPKSYKDKKQDQKNNTLNNQYQESKNVGATENFDCDGIVIFNFSEFGIEAVKCESGLFDYFTVSQAKAINTISHVNAAKIDIVAFNNALARKDIKREAKDFKQFVGWCYLVAVDAKGSSVAKGSMTVNDCDLAESVVVSDARNINMKQSLTSKEIDNTNNASVVKRHTATNKMTDQAHHNENAVKFGAESFNSNDGDGQTLRFDVASDAENALPNQSLTTMDIDNTDRLNVIAEDNANNEGVDQGNYGGDSEIVVDANGVNESKNVIINGNDQARDSRETVTNDNNYQKYISADKAVKDNEIVVDQYLNLGEYKYKDFVKLCLKRGIASESEVVKSATCAIKTYGNLNFDQLYNGILYSHFTVPKLIDRQEVSETEHENTKAQANTKAKNPLSKNPSLKLPTLTDLKMPVVEKEVLKKDWASLAEQSLGLATVTECQKVALVAIIDYVKRKGVAITSDQEVYEWLYHTVANYEYYFSGATSFKHLANILIKRLVNQSFNRPSGFDNWRKMIGGSSGFDSIKIDNKTYNNYLKNYSREIDLRLDRIVAKVSISNSEKNVKKCSKTPYSNWYSDSFLV